LKYGEQIGQITDLIGRDELLKVSFGAISEISAESTVRFESSGEELIRPVKQA